MFDLCSDTESAKTIKALREIVDSLARAYAQAACAASMLHLMCKRCKNRSAYWNQRSTASRTTSLRVAPNQ